MAERITEKSAIEKQIIKGGIVDKIVAKKWLKAL